MKECAFSIVIPTCDRPELVLRAISSALFDLPAGAEVIVVDDGKRVPVSNEIERVFGQTPRLQLISSTGGEGAAAARNLGVAHARGRFIFFLDDDDVFVPGYVAAVMREAATNPGAAWGFSPALRHGASGPPELPKLKQLNGQILGPVPDRQHLCPLSRGFWIEKKLFELTGGIDSTLKVNEDTEFCIRLLAQGHMPWVSRNPGVSVYVANEGNGANRASVTLSTKASERAKFFAEILSRHQDFLRTAPEIKTFLQRRLLKQLAKAGRLRDGLKAASQTGSLKEFLFFLLNCIAYWVRFRSNAA